MIVLKNVWEGLEIYVTFYNNVDMHLNYGIIQQCIKTISCIYPHDYLLEEC